MRPRLVTLGGWGGGGGVMVPGSGDIDVTGPHLSENW